MTTYTKSELKRLGVKFNRVPNLNEIEVSWPEPGYRQVLRVCAMGRDKFAVARGGLGGTFNLSYDWVCSTLPLNGTGPATLRAMVLDSRKTIYRYTAHGTEPMTSLLVSMLDVARKMLKEIVND